MNEKSKKGRNLIQRKLAVLLVLFLILGACTAPRYDTLEEKPTLAPLLVDEPHMANLTLFYYSEEGDRHTAYRRVALQEGQTRALMTVRTLFSNDWNDEYSQMPEDWQPVFDTRAQGLDVHSVEVSGNTANIYIQSIDGASKPPNDQRVKARVPLANSLIETLGVDYVNIYFNGEAMVDYYNNPLGAMARYDGSPQEYFQEVESSRDQPLSYVANVTLYYPDASGEYLVMETRPMELADQRGVEVVNALISGANNPELQNIIMEKPDQADGYVSISTESYIATSSNLGEDGGILDENLNDEENLQEEDPTAMLEMTEGAASPAEAKKNLVVGEEEKASELESAQNQEGQVESALPLQRIVKNVNVSAQERFGGMGRAAIVCSLQGLFNDVSGVTVSFGGTEITAEVGETGADFRHLLGQLIYPTASSDGGSLLYQETAVVPQDKAEDPETVLAALFSVQITDHEAVFDADWQEMALRSAVLSGTTAIVDLSSAAVQAWDQMEEAEFRLQLYAIVNSLTQIHGIRKVQFLIDGERIEQVGALVLSQPLLANPAMNTE